MKSGRGFSFLYKAVRLATLAAFFHFSGLNNAMTCMVSSSANLNNAGFAPVAARWVAHSMAPSTWVRVAAQSSRTLHLSARNTVRCMTLQTSVFQDALVSQTLQTLPDVQAPAVSTVSAERVEALSSSAVQSRQTYSYMRSVRLETWVQERPFQRTFRSFKYERGFTHRAPLNEERRIATLVRSQTKQYGRFLPEQFNPAIFEEGHRALGDPAAVYSGTSADL